MSYPAIWLATATVGRYRCPQKRLQTARNPPVYTNSSPDYRACNSLTPSAVLTPSIPVHRWIRAKTGSWVHSEWKWTADISKVGQPVPCLEEPAVCAEMPTRYYAYVDRVMLHEFGHALGLHDFYADASMDHLDAVMNTDNGIRVEDIEQLRAIYLLHSSH